MDRIALQLLDSQNWGRSLQICINDHSLIDLVRKIEQPFADQEGRPDAAGAYDWLAGFDCDLFDPSAQEVMVLGCTCGFPDCWPLYCKVERFADHVCWSGFFNPYRTPKSVSGLDDPAHQRIVPWSHSGLGSFKFELETYDAALAGLRPTLMDERNALKEKRLHG